MPLAPATKAAAADPPAVEWSRVYGGPGWDGFSDVAGTSDGGMIAAGESSSGTGDVGGNKGGTDAWVVKLSGVGEIEWTRSLGGVGHDSAAWARELSGGGYIVGGYTTSRDGDFPSEGGGGDAWAARLDPAGAVVWARAYGGPEWEQAAAVIEGPDGGFLMVGVTGSGEAAGSGCGPAAAPGARNRRVWAVTLDADGRRLEASCPDGLPYASGDPLAAARPGGGAAVAYRPLGGGAGRGPIAAGLVGPGGAPEGHWTLDDGKARSPFGVAAAEGGGVAVAGSSVKPWAGLFGPDGGLVWETVLETSPPDSSFDAVAAHGGGFLFAGSADGPSGGGADLLAAAVGPDGAVLWSITMGGGDPDFGAAAATLAGGAAAVAGSTESYDGDLSFRSDRGDAPDGWIVKLAPPR
jgi:hypothetical protein